MASNKEEYEGRHTSGNGSGPSVREQLDEYYKQKHDAWRRREQMERGTTPAETNTHYMEAQGEQECADEENSPTTDEELARRIQEEEWVHVQRRSTNQRNEESGSSLWNTLQPYLMTTGRIALAVAGAMLSSSRAMTQRTPEEQVAEQIERDEAFARQLQEEEEDSHTPQEEHLRALHNLLTGVGGFHMPSNSEFILPGMSLRMRLVTDGNQPSVIPMPIIQGGDGQDAQSLQNMLGQEISYEQLLELQERLGFVNRGASEEEIGRETVLRQADHAVTHENCAICLEQFSEGQELRTLPCLHNYHAGCIDQWLKTNRSCPVCKLDI